MIISVYELATSDGVNEEGLAGNLLYLAEADYGDPATSGKPGISVGAWLQYVLDNCGTVAEAFAAMQADPFTVVSANAPNGWAAWCTSRSPIRPGIRRSSNISAASSSFTTARSTR